MPSICDKINKGFSLCADDPITEGIEDQILLFSEDDFVLTFDPTNPLIVTGITAVAAAKMYAFEGTNNSFNTTSKSVKTAVGQRWTEEIDFNIAGLSTDIKTTLTKLGYHKVKAIIVNNYKGGDSTVELFGANNSLLLMEASRNASDENFGGGYSIKLSNPDKIREPFPPRAISIAPPPVGGVTPPATLASTLVAIQALIFTGP